MRVLVSGASITRVLFSPWPLVNPRSKRVGRTATVRDSARIGFHQPGKRNGRAHRLIKYRCYRRSDELARSKLYRELNLLHDILNCMLKYSKPMLQNLTRDEGKRRLPAFPRSSRQFRPGTAPGYDDTWTTGRYYAGRKPRRRPKTQAAFRSSIGTPLGVDATGCPSVKTPPSMRTVSPRLSGQTRPAVGFLRRWKTPSSNSPKPNSASVPGSGIAW